MDTWFTNEPFIKRLLSEGLNVIGMLKDNKQKYHYRKGLYNLSELAAIFAKTERPGDILGTVIVTTKKDHIPVKLVFVRNRNKRNEYIILLSIDCSLSDTEIIRRYGARWSIECCFKICKSLLRLGKKFQPVNYDSTVSATALVFTRYIILEFIRRKTNDLHSHGELFFICYDDVKDIEISEALESLMSIMSNGLIEGRITLDSTVYAQLLDWYTSQPAFIRSICYQSMTAAGLISDDTVHEKSSVV